MALGVHVGDVLGVGVMVADNVSLTDALTDALRLALGVHVGDVLGVGVGVGLSVDVGDAVFAAV